VTIRFLELCCETLRHLLHCGRAQNFDFSACGNGSEQQKEDGPNTLAYKKEAWFHFEAPIGFRVWNNNTDRATAMEIILDRLELADRRCSANSHQSQLCTPKPPPAPEGRLSVAERPDCDENWAAVGDPNLSSRFFQSGHLGQHRRQQFGMRGEQTAQRGRICIGQCCSTAYMWIRSFFEARAIATGAQTPGITSAPFSVSRS
jgi:hypothetical protein